MIISNPKDKMKARIAHILTGKAKTPPVLKPVKPDLPLFSFIDFMSRRVGVHCRTREEAQAFLQRCHDLGYTWVDGDSLIRYSDYYKYGSKTCYTYFVGREKSGIKFGAQDEYESGYTFVEYSKVRFE